MSQPERDPLQALETATGSASKRSEFWPVVGLVLVGAMALLYLYMGSRPGGDGPVWAFTRGRDTLTLTALAVLAFALVRSLIKRPFLQPRRARGFVALALVVGLAPFPFPYPTSYVRSPSVVEFELPVEGEWRVLWGGEGGQDNRLAYFDPARCTALHLVRDADLERMMSGERPEDPAAWEAFGSELCAPSAGEVIAAVGEHPDGNLGQPADDVPREGNHVTLEVAPGQYLHLAHLRQGSLRVSVGDQVSAGQVLGEVGSSGFSALSPMPHVAWHLNDRPDPRAGEGIPWSLSRYVSDGKPVERGLPSGGVSSAGPAGQKVQRQAP